MDKLRKVVWMDMETTGTSVQRDYILEVCFVVYDEFMKKELKRKNWVVHVPKPVLWGTISPQVANMHTKNGLLEDVHASKYTVSKMSKDMVDFLSSLGDKRLTPAGASISLDLSFLKKRLPAVAAFFHYRVLDISSIMEFVKRIDPEAASLFVRKEDDVHRAMSDVDESIRLFNYYKSLFEQKKC